MAALNFESNLLGAAGIGAGSFALLTEFPDGGPVFPAPAPFDPTVSNFIVQTDQKLRVNLTWETIGALWLVITGKWFCNVYLEEMGAGEYAGGPFSANVNVVNAFNHKYQLDVNIPANVIPAGLYRIVVAVTIKGGNPAVTPLPIAAFSDIGIVQVFEAA